MYLVDIQNTSLMRNLLWITVEMPVYHIKSRKAFLGQSDIVNI